MGVALEFVPYAAVRDLPGAAAVVEAAGRANGGVLVNSFISTVREARRRRSWPSRRTLLLTTISSYAMAPNLMQVPYDNERSSRP